jgi:HD-GYP domain-containing protein (c-di-GMP phosphodiesterase class II)
MLSEKKILPINELKVGMIAASDIYIDKKVLLANGVAITETILNKLKQTYIVDKLEVYLRNDSAEVLTLSMKTVEELESTLNDFSSNLEAIFNNISTLSISEMDEIRTFSKKVQAEFKQIGTVIKNILFYGSGDDTIYRHSVNVTAVSFILGKWLGLDETELNLLTYSAILHDFGKMKIGKDIINKKSKLTSKEYDTFKTHPVIGYNIVKLIPYIDSSVSYGVLMHHERMDGSGFPLGIKEDKIHKFAKIIAIADIFDEVNSNRYDKKVCGPFEALEVIREESLRKLDSSYCNVFLSHIVNYFMGENVLLNDERSCKVIQVNMNDLTKPLLLDDNGFLDLKKEKDLYVKKLVI